jgi:hypothetical protein
MVPIMSHPAHGTATLFGLEPRFMPYDWFVGFTVLPSANRQRMNVTASR